MNFRASMSLQRKLSMGGFDSSLCYNDSRMYIYSTTHILRNLFVCSNILLSPFEN